MANNGHNTNQSLDAGAIPVRTLLQAFPDPDDGVPATVANGTPWDSGPISMRGYRNLVVSAELDQAGSMVVQRYIDAAGTIPLYDPFTQAMTANTLAWIAVNDGLPFASFSVVITNAGVPVAAVTNFAILETVA